MAKRTGFLTIPSVMVGGDKSNEVDIQVLPQSSVLPGEADIFISSEVDFQQSFVLAQIECEILGGFLAEVKTWEEHQFLKSLAKFY